MTSYFQNGGNGVRPLLADAYAVATAGCPVALSACDVIDVLARAFNSAGIPVTKEPTGPSRTEGKRPNGMIYDFIR